MAAAGRGGAGPPGAGAAGSPSSKLLDAGPAVVGYADIAGRWRGSRSRCGGGSGRSTRWPGWTCCCTGSAGDLGTKRQDGAERGAAVADAAAEDGGFYPELAQVSAQGCRHAWTSGTIS